MTAIAVLPVLVLVTVPTAVTVVTAANIAAVQARTGSSRRCLCPCRPSRDRDGRAQGPGGRDQGGQGGDCLRAWGKLVKWVDVGMIVSTVDRHLPLKRCGCERGWVVGGVVCGADADARCRGYEPIRWGSGGSAERVNGQLGRPRSRKTTMESCQCMSSRWRRCFFSVTRLVKGRSWERVEKKQRTEKRERERCGEEQKPRFCVWFRLSVRVNRQQQQECLVSVVCL